MVAASKLRVYARAYLKAFADQRFHLEPPTTVFRTATADAWLTSCQGTANFKAGHYVAAEHDFTLALQRTSGPGHGGGKEDPFVYYNRGVTRAQIGDTGGALRVRRRSGMCSQSISLHGKNARRTGSGVTRRVACFQLISQHGYPNQTTVEGIISYIVSFCAFVLNEAGPGYGRVSEPSGAKLLSEPRALVSAPRGLHGGREGVQPCARRSTQAAVRGHR